MPAWITSELRELVCVPIASSASRMITSRPAIASSRATARPTTPAPTTTASTLSMALSTREPAFDAGPGECRDGEAAAEHQPAAAAHEPGAAEAQHEAARRPGAGDLAEHHAGEHPAVGVERHAHVREGKRRCCDPREDAHLA